MKTRTNNKRKNETEIAPAKRSRRLTAVDDGNGDNDNDDDEEETEALDFESGSESNAPESEPSQRSVQSMIKGNEKELKRLEEIRKATPPSSVQQSASVPTNASYDCIVLQKCYEKKDKHFEPYGVVDFGIAKVPWGDIDTKGECSFKLDKLIS